MKRQIKIRRCISEIKKYGAGKSAKNLKTWNQGKYPVIFITFKDVKFDSWEKTFEAIRELFTKEAYRHIELRTSKQCDDYDKKIFERFLAGDMNEVELSGALMNMSRMLHKHYGVAPIIIIDEYDIPIQQGYMKNYYDKVILLMRNLFSGGFVLWFSDRYSPRG